MLFFSHPLPRSLSVKLRRFSRIAVRVSTIFAGILIVFTCKSHKHSVVSPFLVFSAATDSES